MKLFVSAGIREADFEKDAHGALAVLDLETGKKEVVYKVFPHPFALRSENPRGGTRGYRGLTLKKNKVIVASNDSINFYDKALNYQMSITHPSFGNLHGLSHGWGDCILAVSTVNDTWSVIDLKRGSTKIYEPLDNPEVYQLLSPLLKLRGRDRKPFDSTHDYRERHIEDVLHFNTLIQVGCNVYGMFNSIHTVIQFYPKPKIIWAPPLEWKDFIPAWGQDKYQGLGIKSPHDLIPWRGRLLINSSGDQRLVALDPQTGELETIYNLSIKNREGWTRGLDVIEDTALVGDGDGGVSFIDLRKRALLERRQIFDPVENKECAIYGVACEGGFHDGKTK